MFAQPVAISEMCCQLVFKRFQKRARRPGSKRISATITLKLGDYSLVPRDIFYTFRHMSFGEFQTLFDNGPLHRLLFWQPSTVKNLSTPLAIYKTLLKIEKYRRLAIRDYAYFRASYFQSLAEIAAGHSKRSSRGDEKLRIASRRRQILRRIVAV